MHVNKKQLEELSNKRFLLKSTDPYRSDFNMICSASTVDENPELLETIHNIYKYNNKNDFLKDSISKRTNNTTYKVTISPILSKVFQSIHLCNCIKC